MVEWLAFTPYSADTRTWKRYRGGMASDIWLFHLKNKTAQRMTEWEGTDSIPMWHGQTVYYLCDAGHEHRLNIWAYETATGARRQVTNFSEYDVKWPVDRTGRPRARRNRLPASLPICTCSTWKPVSRGSWKSRSRATTRQIMPRTINAADFIAGADLSPTGSRVVVGGTGRHLVTAGQEWFAAQHDAHQRCGGA